MKNIIKKVKQNYIKNNLLFKSRITRTLCQLKKDKFKFCRLKKLSKFFKIIFLK